MVIKRKFIKFLERLAIIIIVAVATTIAIKATDKEAAKQAEEQSGFCPNDMVLISSPDGPFCIDKYEASTNSNCTYSDPQNANQSRDNLDFGDCKPVSEKGKTPWRNLTQNQAALACAKAGKRLPTNKEWYLAALGTPDKVQNWTDNDCQVSKNWGKQPGLTGSAYRCVSGAGAHDMIGNVWEWVDGTVKDGLFEGEKLPASGYILSMQGNAMPGETNKNSPEEIFYDDYFWLKDKGVRGMARGGYWDNKSDAGQYSIYAVTEATFAGIGVGFRCVR